MKLLFLLFLTPFIFFAQDIATAKQKVKDAPDDSARVRKLNRLAFEFLSLDVDSAQFYLDQSLELTQQIGYKKGEAFYHLVNGIILSEHLGKPDLAVQNYHKAIQIYEEINAEIYMPDCFNNIGNIYINDLNNPDKAIENFQKALQIDQKFGITEVIPQRLYNIGSVFEMNEKYDSALSYYENGLNLAIENNNHHGTYLNYLGKGSVYIKNGDLEQGIYFSEQALSFAKNLGNMEFIANAHFFIGNQFYNIEKYQESIFHLEKSIKAFDQINSIQHRQKSLKFLADAHLNIGKFEEASRYFDQFVTLNDSLNIIAQNKIIQDVQEKYETAEKEKKIQLLEKDKEIQSTQAKILWIVLCGAVVIIVLVVKQIILVKASRKRLLEKNKVIRKQFGEIHDKNKQITDSITYAKRIQSSILKPEIYQTHFPHSAIFYRPKDIVSGDFYWIHHEKDTSYFAVADCTGHGVPGAFMSIIANNLLERAIVIRRLTDPSKILETVNNDLIQLLKKEDESNNDGMDIVVCKLNHTNKQLSFSGAHNSLYHIRDNELTEFKGDKIFIGKQMVTASDFTLQEIQLESNDHLFLFTDGFVDQKGGPKNKKYFYAPFRKLITEATTISPSQQPQFFEKAFEDWKGDHEQFDDLCILGIKIV